MSEMIEVLKAIEANPKLSIEQIATMTGHTTGEVADALEKYESDRVITGYKTVINWEKAGVDQVAAFIEVRLVPQRGSGFDKIAARIYRYPEVRSVWLVSGTYDLGVMVIAPTMRLVSEFVGEHLATIDAVQGTTTHFIMKRYKEDGQIFAEPDQPPVRLAVTP